MATVGEVVKVSGFVEGMALTIDKAIELATSGKLSSLLEGTQFDGYNLNEIFRDGKIETVTLTKELKPKSNGKVAAVKEAPTSTITTVDKKVVDGKTIFTVSKKIVKVVVSPTVFKEKTVKATTPKATTPKVSKSKRTFKKEYFDAMMGMWVTLIMDANNKVLSKTYNY